eukprot:TRINITY_DN67184_c15_g7_i1.p2 TRINITY_DN67184_c15_g7~~TRINITY_DN67184_c15_g7_i1.p2  ORF type:complete len:241 (-),score=123.42 TRINITY_DN67184_c15_g7_i1:113-772(-)
MPAFKDLDKDSGLAELNNFLAGASYLEGFRPSQADVAVFHQVASNVDAETYPHVARWYKHIASFTNEQRAAWVGDAKAAAGGKPAAAAAADDDSDDDSDFNLSDDDDDDGAAAAIIAKKKAEADKKKKAQPPARSSVCLDIKPYGADTDMDQLAKDVRAIVPEGLRWGGQDFVPIAFGVKKLRILCTIVDDLVSTDDLIDSIEALEDCQSVDIYAFNKV